jgi:hypothetical protein
LVRLYAWGPKSGDWDQAGRWEIRWQWPFGGWPEIRSTSTAQAPWSGLDAARRWLGIGQGATTWLLAATDDADHALLVGRRTSTAPATADLLVLETDRAPLEVRRPGGDAFQDVEGAARVGGRWYVATPQSPGELAATVVWMLEGTGAREIARVPRTNGDARPQLRLARRADGRALGLVVDAIADTSPSAMRWVMSVDLESGALGEPEPLAPADLSDRSVTLCTGDDSGWDVELPFGGAVLLQIAPRWGSSLQSPAARMRISRERACVLRVLGSVDAYAATAPDALVRPIPAAARRADLRAVEVSVLSARTRYGLRCWARP